ncbi:MAG: Thiol-disulfide oxidoreductase ResA [Planctomycetota bacterium]
MAMLPHERSLVERLKNEPFALLGINTDTDKQEYLRKAKEMNVTWRSAWEGKTGGPISSKWGIEGYPTLYLIDHKGVIQKYWLGGPDEKELDKAIDELVAKAKADK